MEPHLGWIIGLGLLTLLVAALYRRYAQKNDLEQMRKAMRSRIKREGVLEQKNRHLP